MLFRRELEHEIGWKPFTIAVDLLVQALNRDTVEPSKVGIENDFLAAKEENSRLHREERSVSAPRHFKKLGGSWLLHFEIAVRDLKS